MQFAKCKAFPGSSRNVPVGIACDCLIARLSNVENVLTAFIKSVAIFGQRQTASGSAGART